MPNHVSLLSERNSLEVAASWGINWEASIFGTVFCAIPPLVSSGWPWAEVLFSSMFTDHHDSFFWFGEGSPGSIQNLFYPDPLEESIPSIGLMSAIASSRWNIRPTRKRDRNSIPSPWVASISNHRTKSPFFTTHQGRCDDSRLPKGAYGTSQSGRILCFVEPRVVSYYDEEEARDRARYLVGNSASNSTSKRMTRLNSTWTSSTPKGN